MSSPLLTVNDLAGGYGSGDAITRFTFDLAAGETIAVLGPNGGGKTTLFRALLGELPQRAGEVSTNEGIAYVPQSERSRLDFPVSALDVAAMGTYASVPWYRRLGARELGAARESLDRVGMGSQASKRFGALSGGQRQRVLIARALARGARILLLDEPYSGLDRPSEERLHRLLAELRSQGSGILLATHDIHQARDADRVLCINREQVAFGPPAQALTAQVLERTYGGELIELPGGGRAVVVQHHEH